jgi:DNA polymerase I
VKVGFFDTEANGLLPEATQLWCAVVKDKDSGDIWEFTPGTGIQLCELLERFDVLIGHNSIGYDFPLLRKLFGWEYQGIKVDTLLMSRTQRPNRRSPAGCSASPHSVEAWAVRLGGQQKVENDDWSVYSPVMLERCRADVDIQERLYEALLREGRGEGWAKAHRLNNKLFHYLQLQEEYGWTVDQAHLAKCLDRLNKWIMRIDRAVSPSLPQIIEVKESKKAGEYGYVKKPFLKSGELNRFVSAHYDSSSHSVVGPFSRLVFRPVDLNSNAEVKDYLLAQGWEPKEWNTDDEGNPRSPKLSKDDPFEGIQGSLGWLIARRVQCRQRIGVLEGWASNIREDGRIATRVNGIASTGRMKHSVVVNVPSPHSKAFFAKQMRQVFVAKEGWTLVGVDSASNQMRQLCRRMKALDGTGDLEFTDAVLTGDSAKGTDMHTLNQKRSGAPSRSQAKNFFYGFIFGAQAPKIAKTIKISVERAKQLIDDYFNEMPLLKRVIDELTAEWRATAQKYYDPYRKRWIYKDGYITGVDGRPILVDTEHKILCYALQSDEAIQMAVAYVIFHKWMEKAGYVLHKDWGMLIWMHDEFQFECKPEMQEHAAELAKESIKWAGEFLKMEVPHAGTALFGKNWYDCH